MDGLRISGAGSRRAKHIRAAAAGHILGNSQAGEAWQPRGILSRDPGVVAASVFWVGFIAATRIAR
jgi:hypothetical protein